ncbi:MAG: acyl-CoA dehydrogenase family protein [Anaerolineales bacterium]|nr:acyl-CoA dehydrogenase family protein [Anaerolineales bacterium]
MTHLLSAQQREAQAAFRAFVDKEVIPNAHCYEQDERIPPEMVARLGAAGYLGAVLPEEYGGQNMDMITYGLLNEELGRGSSSVRGLMMLSNMIGHTLVRWGSEAQKERWLRPIASGEVLASLALTEPAAGTDVKEVETTAVLDGDSYVLNGHKIWITLGQVSTLFLVLAKWDGKLSAFLVERDTPGFEIEPMRNLSGLKATMLAKLHFNDCRIPKDSLVGRAGFGLAPVAFTALNLGRYSIAWGCVGIAQACLDATLDYTRNRKQFGVFLREHQLIQHMVTDMIANVKASRLLCIEAGHLTESGDPAAFVETLIAKYFASTTATKTANDAAQAHGAVAFQDSHPVQRHLRDAKIMELIEGTTQIHQIKIAEYSY